jgi:uncharacterized protein (DUF1015 family)
LATIRPFQPYRYTAKAGDPAKLVTQPYDKISPEMQAAYMSASPYNLVRVILGPRNATDGESDNVYTRAAKHLDEWIRDGILAQDPVPAFYAYSQDFEVPDTGERAVRKGFIGLCKVEDYSANAIYRHERTLAGPKKDRLELLRHTRAHFGQIFVLYPDQQGDVDKLLGDPKSTVLDVEDDYHARHKVWPVADSSTIPKITELMAAKKLLIADGHHRYETALAFRDENPQDPAAQYVMMTFVNMYSPGLKILATHRVLRNMVQFDAAEVLKEASTRWSVSDRPSVESIKTEFRQRKPGSIRIGVVTSGGVSLLERPRAKDELDVPVLHEEVLGGLLGISEEAVRDEKHIKYVRGIDAAAAEVRDKGAQAAFLLEPTPVEDMARIAFAGGVMPQKSTDFYPKLLSGAAIYKL